MSKSRGYSITINNDTFEDLLQLVDLIVSYKIIGFEVGMTGTPHIQAYVHYANPVSFNSLKKAIPRAHIEIARGTPQQNIEYCSKDGEYYEFGNRPRHGGDNSVFKDFVLDIMSGDRTIESVRRDYPIHYFMHEKRVRALLGSKKKHHERKLNIIPYEERYKYAKKYDSVSIDAEIDTYDGEEAMFIRTYAGGNFVMDWVNGFPPKIRRGYDLITVDPEYVYMMHTDKHEYNHIIKKYVDYIDNVYEPEF